MITQGHMPLTSDQYTLIPQTILKLSSGIGIGTSHADKIYL